MLFFFLNTKKNCMSMDYEIEFVKADFKFS